MVKITIEGRAIECAEGSSILSAADAADIYIPRLCSHSDLSPIDELIWSDSVYQADTKIAGEKPDAVAGKDSHCNLCMVQIEGQDTPVNSCLTFVEEGMVVRIDTEDVIRHRKQALSKLLSDHPHSCLTCAQKEGCSRTDCSSNVPVDERCCVLLGHCELEKISDFIGIPPDTPKYKPGKRPVIKGDPLFDRDYNLCIGCLRCVRICQQLQSVDILGTTWKNNRAFIGTMKSGGLKEAQCRFCGACVEICPTGALQDKDNVPAVRRDAPVPCMNSCPAKINIPEYVKAIAIGKFDEALEIIRDRVPFPGILGYVCFHPCEDMCRRSEIDEAVAICDLKRFAAEANVELDASVNNRRPDTGKKIAIVGSGPAGLTAAYYLAIMGHQVALVDKESKPGGMLRHGIPDYRLPQDLLDREMKILDGLDVTLKMNHKFNTGNWSEELKNQGFDSVLYTIGASVSKSLPLDNSELEGIYPGLEFLKSAKLSGQPKLEGRVVVIGGGNVAIDAAMTAVRLGASSVQLTCLESRDEMPAHNWEIRQAEEEGIEIHPSWGPKQFIATGSRVSGIEFKRCTRVFDERGHFGPQYDEGETKSIDADTVIVTIGQQSDAELLNQFSNKSGGPANFLKPDENFCVGEGVFASGDLAQGPSSVINAIADGRAVADAMDKFLGGNGFVDDSKSYEAGQRDADISHEDFQQSRQKPVLLDIAERKSGFGIIQQTFTAQTAIREASRCLQCQMRQSISPVVLPPEKWQTLNAETVASVPEAEGVFQLLNAEKKVIRITGSINLRQGLLECLENPGEAVWFISEEDPMYTKRESELIQQYLQEYGEMPGSGDDDLDDLF